MVKDIRKTLDNNSDRFRNTTSSNSIFRNGISYTPAVKNHILNITKLALLIYRGESINLLNILLIGFSIKNRERSGSEGGT